jgi:hypothetical protein
MDFKNALENLVGMVPIASSWTTETHTGCWQGGRLFMHRPTGDFVFIPIGDKRPKDKRRLTFLGDAVLNVKGWTQHEHNIVLTNPTG